METWIRVEERLPEVGVEVAVCVFYAGSMNAHNDRLVDDSEWEVHAFSHVTHWAPLPEIPNR